MYVAHNNPPPHTFTNKQTHLHLISLSGAGEAERGHAAEGHVGLIVGGDEAAATEQGQGHGTRRVENRSRAAGNHTDTQRHNLLVRTKDMA